MSKIKNKLLEFLNNEGSGLMRAAIAAIVVTLLFTAYLKWVGLPMTRARNAYNEGVILLNLNAKTEARQKFNESLAYWKTPEAEQVITRLNQDL